MSYRVFSGPKGSPDVSPLDRQQMLYKECDALDDALSWARHVEATGRVALMIEGDDGVRLTRREIGAALRSSAREHIRAAR